MNQVTFLEQTCCAASTYIDLSGAVSEQHIGASRSVLAAADKADAGKMVPCRLGLYACGQDRCASMPPGRHVSEKSVLPLKTRTRSVARI